jgi:hypothetical protein
MSKMPTNYYSMIDTINKRCVAAPLTGKEYQRKGVEWCIEREREPTTGFIKGGLVADEMGLGKTLTMIMVLLLNYKERTLFVVPPNILYQWYDEIYKFTGHKPIIYHGSNKNKITKEQLEESSIVLTTYHTISATKLQYSEKKTRLLHQVVWERIIYDEAHNLKNRNILHYGAMSMTTKICWFITGTPIQNKLSDYRNLCRIMGYSSRNPVIPVLRRTLNDVNIHHNGISQYTTIVDWSENSLRLAALKHRELISANGDYVIAKMQRCRQICAMPSLYNRIDKTNNTIYENDKMVEVANHIYSRRKSGNGKLVFCNYTAEMNEYNAYISGMGLKVVCINGKMTMKERHNLLSSYHMIGDEEREPLDNKHINLLSTITDDIVQYINDFIKIDVCLIQIQSACDGLNLQHLSEVYFPSPAWNPSTEGQAIARCYRTGQKKRVNVYRFYMNSLGEGLFNMDEYVCHTQKKKINTMREFYSDIAPIL